MAYVFDGEELARDTFGLIKANMVQADLARLMASEDPNPVIEELQKWANASDDGLRKAISSQILQNARSHLQASGNTIAGMAAVGPSPEVKKPGLPPMRQSKAMQAEIDRHANVFARTAMKAAIHGARLGASFGAHIARKKAMERRQAMSHGLGKSADPPAPRIEQESTPSERLGGRSPRALVPTQAARSAPEQPEMGYFGGSGKFARTRFRPPPPEKTPFFRSLAGAASGVAARNPLKLGIGLLLAGAATRWEGHRMETANRTMAAAAAKRQLSDAQRRERIEAGRKSHQNRSGAPPSVDPADMRKFEDFLDLYKRSRR
jgi:hypothetical protein